MNSFADIFWLVLTQLQNRFFVEHLPVAAYVRCVKEKEWKKWNSVFLLYSVWHSSLWQWRFSRGNKNKLRTFQPQIWKKIKNSQPLTKFTGSYKKKSVIGFIVDVKWLGRKSHIIKTLNRIKFSASELYSSKVQNFKVKRQLFQKLKLLGWINSCKFHRTSLLRHL